jgi:hypothetical protein
MDQPEIEALASAESRKHLPFGRLMRLYLDPFALFKSLASGPEALRYNRQQRRMLLAYVRRWALIALVCLTAFARFAALARGQPLLWIPLAALEVGFSSALCLSFLSIAAYIVLGLERL